jgi:tryptophan-rich sensory protein
MNKRTFVMLLVVALVFAAALPASAQSLSLDVDTQPLFDQINTWFPVFFAVFAIIGGIAAAIVLGRSIISAIVDAFRNGFG